MRTLDHIRHTPFPLLVSLLLPVVIAGCIDRYDPELETGPLRLVVDGQITDQPGPYTVRLSYTGPYNNDNVTTPLAGADLYITDDAGGNFPLTEVRRGTYQTDSVTFTGQPGRTYVLHVRTSAERTYESLPETLRPAPPVDTVYGRYAERVNAQGVAGSGFDIYLETVDAPGKGDFYRWNWIHYEALEYCFYNSFTPPNGGPRQYLSYACCSDCWAIKRCPGCINIGEDAFIDGNRIRRLLTTAPYNSRQPYFVIVEQYVVSERVFRFWEAVNGQINRTGGIFDRPPATINGNLFNPRDSTEQVLGVFSAAGVSRRSAYIPRNYVEAPPYNNANANVEWVPQRTCEPCRENFFQTGIRPEGW